MIIGDLFTYFENIDKPVFYLTDVFSWRGVYAEVAFTISKEGSREESLELLHRACSEVFRGWKGGYFTYNYSTEAHFELDESTFDGDRRFKTQKQTVEKYTRRQGMKMEVIEKYN